MKFGMAVDYILGKDIGYKLYAVNNTHVTTRYKKEEEAWFHHDN